MLGLGRRFVFRCRRVMNQHVARDGAVLVAHMHAQQEADRGFGLRFGHTLRQGVMVDTVHALILP